MSKNKFIVSLIATISILLPALIGISRNSIISAVSESKGVHELELTEDTTNKYPYCLDGLCFKRYFIEYNFSNIKFPSIGFHSAMLDSYPSVNGLPLDTVPTSNDFQISWYEFKTYQLPIAPTSSDKTQIEVNCASPMGTKKLGMDNPKIYIGSKRALNSLGTVFNLFNVHLYILISLITLIIGFYLSTSELVLKAGTGNIVWKETIFIILAVIAYSHVFDGILNSYGIPRSVTEVIVRLFIAPAVFMFFYPDNTLFKWFTAIFLCYFSICFIESPIRAFILHSTYRWAFLACFALAVLKVFLSKNHFKFLPFVLLILHDVVVLFNIWPAHSGLYLWPLGLLGVFLVKNIDYLMNLYNTIQFYRETSSISKKIVALVKSSTFNASDLEAMLNNFCNVGIKLTSANTVGIMYLSKEGPLVASTYFNGDVKKDGRIPAIYSRVIQTKEPLWWKTSAELNIFRPKATDKQKHKYHSDGACVIPLMSNGAIYGAVSFTDFDDFKDIQNSTELREHSENLILRFVEVLTNAIFSNREKELNYLNKLSNDFTTRSLRHIALTTSKHSAIDAFISEILNICDSNVLFFEYNPDTLRLNLVANSKLDAEIEKTWKNIPFRARAEHTNSPFPLTITSRKSIYLDDIKTIYDRMEQQSIDAFEKINARTFLSMPVMLGEQILGLICIMNESLADPLIRQSEFILENPLKLLAFHIKQYEASQVAIQKEKIIVKYMDPELLEKIANNESDIGTTIAPNSNLPCLLISHDFRNTVFSTQKEPDSALYAKKVSDRYNLIKPIALKYSGDIEESGSDSLISLFQESTFNNDYIEQNLKYLAECELLLTKNLKIKQTPHVLHRGLVFRGSILSYKPTTWSTCGLELENILTINKYLRKHPEFYLAISDAYTECLNKDLVNFIKSKATQTIKIQDLQNKIFLLDQNAASELFVKVLNH